MADVAEQAPFTDPAAAISQGKRHLLVRDYTAAVTAFAEGLELLAQKYGDCGDELGEPYLLYGRALLELAREETGVFGGGVPGGDDDDEDDEDDEIDDDKDENEDDGQVKEASSDDKNKSISSQLKVDESKSDEMNKTDDNKIEEKKVNDEDNEAKDNVTEASIPGTSNEMSKANGDSDEKNDNTIENGDSEADDVNKEDDDEDPGRGIDLQVAWEVLELAKIVFYKRGTTGFKQLAEAHRLLGEVAMESSNHEVAVSDLEKALKILQNVEPYEARAMAELHYQLGLAHSLGNDYDASIEQFNEATNLLEARIKELESAKEPAKNDDPFYTVEGEISELKELLPEIQEKIDDMKDFKEEACRLVIEGIKSKVADGSCTNGAGANSDGASSSGTSVETKVAKPASDISHLVRKKRKNEEAVPETASPCKKQSP